MAHNLLSDLLLISADVFGLATLLAGGVSVISGVGYVSTKLVHSIYNSLLPKPEHPGIGMIVINGQKRHYTDLLEKNPEKKGDYKPDFSKFDNLLGGREGEVDHEPDLCKCKNCEKAIELEKQQEEILKEGGINLKDEQLKEEGQIKI